MTANTIIVVWPSLHPQRACTMFPYYRCLCWMKIDATVLPLLLEAGKKKCVSPDLVEGALCALEVRRTWGGACEN